MSTERNPKISKIETMIYRNISNMSKYVSPKNNLFENTFSKIIKLFFKNNKEWEEFTNNYFSLIVNYEVNRIDLDKMYCDYIKYILTYKYFLSQFATNELLSCLLPDDINKCYSVRLNKIEIDSYHGSDSIEYNIKIELNTPECIEVLSNIYNKIYHTSFNIDQTGKLLTYKNHSIFTYLCNDNFDDNKVNFDFTDYLKKIKEAIKEFNLIIGKLKLK